MFRLLTRTSRWIPYSAGEFDPGLILSVRPDPTPSGGTLDLPLNTHCGRSLPRMKSCRSWVIIPGQVTGVGGLYRHYFSFSWQNFRIARMILAMISALTTTVNRPGRELCKCCGKNKISLSAHDRPFPSLWQFVACIMTAMTVRVIEMPAPKRIEPKFLCRHIVIPIITTTMKRIKIVFIQNASDMQQTYSFYCRRVLR